jgi:DNA primase catalytic core
MNIPQDIIDRIIAASDIVRIIGEDINLRKQGVNYVGLCPFHNEKTPSFVVSPAKGICHCFSCGKGGNVITYLMEKNGLTFPEAVRELGKRYNIEVPTMELSPEEKLRMNERAAVMVVINAAQELLRSNLQANPEAMNYLSTRQVDKQSADKYGLGFAFDFSGLSKELVKRGFEEKYLIEAGLSYKDESKHELRDQFWKRIMFPFFDHKGQIIGYTGRDITGEQPAKYKNTGDTLLFHKGDNVYGLFQARSAIARCDKVYVVEGQFDVLSLARCGVENVVGGSGTAFTDRQRRLLHNVTSNVVFLYDGDDAGMHAALKNLAPFVRDEFKVRCIRLPRGKDPDDMARAKGAELGDYLKKIETDYVSFLVKSMKVKEDEDVYSKLEKVKQIAAIIACEGEDIVRTKLISQLADSADMDIAQVAKLTDEVQPEAVELPDIEKGFLGGEQIADYIDPNDKTVNLTSDRERFFKLIGEKKPWMLYQGMPDKTDIQKLARLTNHVIFHSPVMDCDAHRENDVCRLMKSLFQYGMTVDVCAVDNETRGFVYYYIGFYRNLISETSPNPEVKNIYISRCAEVISYASTSIQTINLDKWADMLGLKLTVMREILKPFNNERKTQKNFQNEQDFVSQDIVDSPEEKIPQYVYDNEEYRINFNRYHFYPVCNKEGMPVCYRFVDSAGNKRRVGNFFIEPLLHVYSKNKEENRRVIQLNSLKTGKSSYVDWPSTVFVKLATLQEMLVLEGECNFENGTALDYAKIWSSISGSFPKCNEIKVYGQQHEGCFLFANAILHEVDGKWVFDYADDLGLMRDKDVLFYSPAYSKVNLGVRSDDDIYAQDRALTYEEVPEEKRITFKKWAELMNEVYKLNDNGKWAILYAILCAFRSEIFPVDRIFTALFFMGPTQSGKTQIAVSIRSLFEKPSVQSSNLINMSDAAFFSILERFRDVPVIFEEYNDDAITFNKFQGLKALVYDGDGKQKRKSATTNDVTTSKVNSPVILLGQEAPQKDDNALANRVVLCEVPKSAEITTDRAKAVFEELKGYENIGLSYLLVDVLKLRTIIREHFRETLWECRKDLTARVELSFGGRSGEQSRIIKTVSMFTSMVKVLEQYAPHIELPFNYAEFMDIAVDKIRYQVNLLMQTDKLAMFFNSVSYLLDQGTLMYGRDFKIERPGELTVVDKGNIQLTPSTTAVLYMNLSIVHKAYLRSMSSGDHPLSLTTLEVNIHSHPSYIGKVKGTRFRWMETQELPVGGTYTDGNGMQRENMNVTRQKVKRSYSTSAVVLNYDVLKALMGIDLERDDVDENGKKIETKVVNKEPDLPF